MPSRRAFALLLLLSNGCASRPGSPEVAPGSITTAKVAVSPSRRRSQSVITEDEIAENPGILSLYDLIGRIRPNFLRGTAEISGSSQVGVRVDAGPQRDVSDLRTIDVRQVKEVRYYSPQEANVRFGIDTNIPVIGVTMKSLK